MARNLLLITSTTSLISLVLLIRLHHARVKTIASFLLAIGIMTLRTIVITTLSIYGFPISKYLYITHGITAIILIPLFHIHFLQLTKNRGWERTDLLHGLPLLVSLAVWPLSDFAYQGLVTTLFFLVILFYWLMILRSFVTGIWNRQSQINIVMKNIRQIREISNVVFGAITIGIFYNLWILFYAPPENDEQSLRHLIVPSLLLLLTSIKLLLDPDIMFGFDVVPRVIKKTGPHNIVSNIWNLQLQKEVVGKRDQSLREKIGELLKDYIPRIEKAAFQTELFRRPGLTVEEFAAELDIPVFHMAYIFRYHSQVTFQDFKKIIQINDAIELMKSGYMKEHTMESLATKVGFASYNPFFVSFRNITGMSPQQYHKSLEA
jgi:AraC-like DNA-binding protein